MGARNTRLLRVRRRAAALCWATVWAVLLSVQLHPRQPGGHKTTPRVLKKATQDRLQWEDFFFFLD
jgi:hypothetical protein